MALNEDIKRRIFAVADALLEKSPTGEFPTIEAVRQESSAGMANVVEAMKEWRQSQRKQVKTVREPLPSDLHGVLVGAGQSLWETAQRLANESLDAAKVAFEAEKADMAQLSAEQSEAFETLASQLESAQSAIAKLEETNRESNAQITQFKEKYDKALVAVAESDRKAILADQKVVEIQNRVDDLRSSLTLAQDEIKGLRNEITTARLKNDEAHAALSKSEQRAVLADQKYNEAVHNAGELKASLDQAQLEIKSLNNSITLLQSKLESVENQHAEQRKRTAEEMHRISEKMVKSDQAHEEARDATAKTKEEAAHLRGQLEALKLQNDALLATLTPRGV